MPEVMDREHFNTGGMKMKDIRIFAAFAALAVLFGCSRSEVPGSETPGKAPQGLRARATLGEGVKSHFGNDGYSLEWDATDRLIAFSANLGSMEGYVEKAEEIYQAIINTPNLDEQYLASAAKDAPIMAYLQLLYDRSQGENSTLRKGVFEIEPTGSGKQSATFVSPQPADYWFATQPQETADDKMFYFSASYPAPDVLPEMKFFQYTELESIHPVIAQLPYPYYDMTIPAEQDGVSYWKYQKLFARESTMGFKQSLLSTDEQLQFNEFFPLTSILEFTLGTTDNISADIASIQITLTTQEEEGGDYGTERYRIAGTVPFFFSWDTASELRLWNRDRTPYMAGFGSDFQLNSWPVDGWLTANYPSATSTLTLNFETPVRVSNQQTAKKYYAVMIPSRCSRVGNTGNPKLTFDAFDADGEKILTKTITTSSTQGIEEGKKYSFDLTLDTYYAPDVLSGLFSVAEGKQVYIASGNLQAYLTPGGVAQDWRIAPHQYDFVGASSYDLGAYEGWFDLFCFSSEHNNFGISTSIDDNEHLGEAVGWTDAYPVAQGRGWRTITDEEGLYLFGVRPNASSLFSFATVVVGSGNTEVKGLIFLPDSWTLPENCSFTGMMVSPIYDYSKNIYYAENAPAGEGLGNKWEDMQAAGAVFWPAAGMRQGTDVDLTVGAYWSGTPNESRPAYGNMLFFCDDVEGVREGSFIPSHYLRSNGACVRLIKEFN